MIQLNIKHPLTITLTAVLVVCVFFSALFFGMRWMKNSAIDHETYQIITLDGGRSYFGSLRNLGHEYALLSNAFFLKAKTPEGTESDAEDATSQESESASNDGLPFTLSRVGNQLYQPVDDLYIRSESIVSWQNLDEDSPVVSAIGEYLESKDRESSGEKKQKKNE